MTEKLKNKRLFLLDMDGTLYLGDRLFECTLEFLNKIKSIGGRYIFITNNSSKSVSAYIDKLHSLGIEANCDDFLTSLECTADYLMQHYPDRLIYALGTVSFRKQLASYGLNITDALSDDISVLVMGFDTELTFRKLDDASILLTRGVEYIATNPDLVCPTEYGYVPDCGSVAQILENATGKKPLYIGKPEKYIVQTALKKTGYSPEEALIVGDRVYTDIACGNISGVDTVLVLSGEGTCEEAERSGVVPTFVMQDVGELTKYI